MGITQIDILATSGRVGRWIMIFALLSLATLSCKSYNGEDTPTPPPLPKEGSTDVLFEINVPQSTVPDTYALAKEDEDHIKTIEILLFKIDPDDLSKKEYTGTPYYCDTISTDAGGSKNKRFVVNLPAGGKYDIVVLANSRDAVRQLLEGGTPPTVTAKDDLLKLLKIDHATKWIADKSDPAYKPFPMWGELVDKTISANLRFQIQMTRMLAKINVTLNTETTTVTDRFKLKEVILVNAHKQGHIVPYKDNITGGRATIPTLVDGSTNTNILHYTDATTTDVGFVNVIYTFEAKKAIAGSLSTATFIIVKGLYVADSQEYYYKVDLGEKKGGIITYHHILRNFEYIIKINSIGGAGYLTLDEAIKGTSSNIESSLVVWDKNELPIVVWDNDNALGFSTDDITLGYAAGVSKPLKLMTDYSGGWKIDKIVDGSGADVSWLTLSPMKSAPGDELSMGEPEFSVTENGGALARVCWVYVSAGALSHKVKVTQTPALRIDKIVWEDYDGVNGVATNDDGLDDDGLTNITVVDSEGNSYSSTSIIEGNVTPTLVVRASIASVVVTYKGYALTLPADKYTHDAPAFALTITDKTLIGKAIHLDKIRTQVENILGGDRITGDYIQVSDVNLTIYADWVPIGTTQAIPFTGSYTGGYATNEFKIDKLTINRPTEEYVGLFGYAYSATFTKINIASGSVKGKANVGGICGLSGAGTISDCTNNATITGENSVAGICGYNNNSLISDCTNSATITGGAFAAGICGYNLGNKITISGCTNSATITGEVYVSGICGYNQGLNSRITDCHNLAGANVSGINYISGICGDNHGEISGCTNAGTVTGTMDYIGGICGNNYRTDAKITDCKNLSGANVSGVQNVGGICGYNEGAISSTTPNGTTNAATVTGTGTGNNIGGIVGYNYGAGAKITGCDNLLGGSVSGAVRVGGIVGYNDNDAIISLCKNAATVTGTGEGYNVGGICGFSMGANSKITGCDNLSTGKVSGVYLIGGICGNILNGTVSTCTNAATVIGTEDEVGGICGSANLKVAITSCDNLLGANVSGVKLVGGICGNNLEGTVSICTNAAIVKGTDDQVGGICGYNNLEVNTSTNTGAVSGYSYVGGVCGLNSGAISSSKNGATITGSATGNRVGGICGQNYGATAKITSCDNLVGGNVSGATQVGGICGENGDATAIPAVPGGAISGCTNAATVTGTGNYTGGIVGHNVGTTAEITDCKNLLGGNVSGVSFVGGICGSNDGEISSTVTNGTTNGATVSGTGGGAVGGICGENTGTISDCTNNNTVTGAGSSIAGICGNNSGTNSKITNCKNSIGADVIGAWRVSGICGYNSGGTISGCTNAAIITGTGTGTGDNFGGICGTNSLGTISGNINEGAVTSKGDYIGGICGNNAGTISDNTNKGAVIGNKIVGGIIGQNANVSSKITSCHNEAGGNVSGQESVGGICGNNSGTISSCTNDAIVTAESMNGGGICGNNFTDGKIYACINTKTAAVSGGNNIGGIAGFNYASTVINACYNLASIGTATSRGAIVGKFAITVVNPVDCYFGENAYFSSTTGSTKFGTGDAWPNKPSAMPYWTAEYWSDIGTWGNGTSTLRYPTLK